MANYPTNQVLPNNGTSFISAGPESSLVSTGINHVTCVYLNEKGEHVTRRITTRSYQQSVCLAEGRMLALCLDELENLDPDMQTIAEAMSVTRMEIDESTDVEQAKRKVRTSRSKQASNEDAKVKIFTAADNVQSLNFDEASPSQFSVQEHRIHYSSVCKSIKRGTVQLVAATPNASHLVLAGESCLSPAFTAVVVLRKNTDNVYIVYRRFNIEVSCIYHYDYSISTHAEWLYCSGYRTVFHIPSGSNATPFQFKCNVTLGWNGIIMAFNQENVRIYQMDVAHVPGNNCKKYVYPCASLDLCLRTGTSFCKPQLCLERPIIFYRDAMTNRLKYVIISYNNEKMSLSTQTIETQIPVDKMVVQVDLKRCALFTESNHCAFVTNCLAESETLANVRMRCDEIKDQAFRVCLQKMKTQVAAMRRELGLPLVSSTLGRVLTLLQGSSSMDIEAPIQDE